MVTLTCILKYQEENSNVAKIHYLRGKTLFLLKYYQHATNDLQQAKLLYGSQFQSELDQILALVKKNMAQQSEMPKNQSNNFTGFDITRSK